MAASAAPMTEVTGGSSPALRTAVSSSGSSTQEQVREYVQNTRRKIEERAGISPSDSAWPSQIVMSKDQLQPRANTSHSPATRLPRPVASSSQPRRSSSRSPAQSGYTSPILSRFPATPGRTPIGTPPLRSGTASPVPERAETFYRAGSQSVKSPAAAFFAPYSNDTSRSQSPLQSPQEVNDHSVPGSPLHQRKIPTLGPPPSARRGPLHSYSQNSYVGSIPEESDARSHPSSNQSLPAGVEVAVPHRAHVANSRSTERLIAEGGSATPDSPKSYKGDLVVKQIDLGRKKRPSLTTIKSGDKLTSAEHAETLVMPYKQPHVSRTTSQKSLTQSISSFKSKGSEPGPAPGFFGSDSVLLESRASSESLGSARKFSDASGHFAEDPTHRPGPGRSPLIPLEDLTPTSPGPQRNISMARSKSIASRYSVDPQPLGTRTSSFRSAATPPESRQKSYANIQPHEDRQSTSELPDLIKRAMRLASDLERKKRPSHRISSGYDGKEWIGDKHNTVTRTFDVRSNLSSTGSRGTTPRTYPGSPYSTRGEQSFMNWPASATNLSNPTYTHIRRTPSETGQRRRRCCGMPLWAFILTILVLILLVAAAVITPIAILVIGKHPSASDNPSSPITTCQAQLTCSNGGTNVIDSSGICKCVCVNGFTGPTCLDTAGTGCTSTTIPNIGQVQVGSALPRLFTTVSESFNIKLDAATIVSIFSAAALSCTTQNSLVVFNGNIGLSKRDTISYTNSTSQDFGRVAVLFVLQDSSQLDAAASAQTSLQSFFSYPSTYSPNNVTLADDYSANLVDYSIAKGDNVVAGSGA